MADYTRRMSIATAASDEGNPNIVFGEYEEQKRRLSMAESKKYQVTEAQPLMRLPLEGELPEGLMGDNQIIVPTEILLNTDHFFLTNGVKEFVEIFDIELAHAYSLLNSFGERILFVTETNEAFTSAYSPHREIDFTILRRAGGVIYEFDGTTTDAIVRCGEKTIGRIKKSLCGMNYVLRNVDDIPVYKVSPVKNTPYDYEVNAIGFSDSIGSIKHKWPRKNDPKLCNTFGITLPKKLSNDSKLLLLSIFILLYFYHHQPGSRGDSRKKFWQAFGFSAVVGFIICIMLATIIVTVVLSKRK